MEQKKGYREAPLFCFNASRSYFKIGTPPAIAR